MAYGDGQEDRRLRAAWSEFCDMLGHAADAVFKDANPSSPLHRADGFRFLTQNLGQAFDLALETRDTRAPAFHRFVSPTRKLGSDCADAVYLQAWIDGGTVYRVWGKRGTARFWNLTVQGARPATGTLHEPFGDTPEVSMLGSDLVTDEEGRFELFIGGPERRPNWMPTTADTRKVFFRQFFDRWDEDPAEVAIECLGRDSAPPVPDPDRMIEAMRWAGAFVRDAVVMWPEFLWRTPALCDAEGVNAFNADNLHQPLTNEDARRGRFLTQMRWALGPNDALVVEFAALDGFWSLTNEAVFGNSMDHRYRSVSLTPSRAVVDEDGTIRVVISHDDPGHANWIDTSGFEAGTLTFRLVQSALVPQLRTTVVPVVELRSVLPARSATVTPEQRSAQLRERFLATIRRSAGT